MIFDALLTGRKTNVIKYSGR